MTRTIALEIGDDFDACIAEAPRNEHPPSLIVHSGHTELVLTGGTVEACDRIGEALADWRASLTEMSPP